MPLIAIAALPRHHREPPETKVETLPAAELFRRATENTEADTDYEADASSTTAGAQYTSHWIVRGPSVLVVGTFNGTEVVNRFEDGRFYSKSQETWQESVLPAGRDYDLLESVMKVWPALRAGTIEELQRDSEVATYRGTCSPGSVAGRMQWLCDRGSLITIVVDVDTERIKSLNATGLISRWPGRWEPGELAVSFGPPTDTEIAPLDNVDTSKLECLARSLGLPLDRSALAERLRDTTTVENGRLFGGCGYQRFPPGSDFGVV
ncbi:MAG: hypothetical protein ABIQ73_01495 [Acidimicrobiales bacterium]